MQCTIIRGDKVQIAYADPGSSLSSSVNVMALTAIATHDSYKAVVHLIKFLSFSWMST